MVSLALGAAVSPIRSAPIDVVVELKTTLAAELPLLQAMPALPANTTYVYDYGANLDAELAMSYSSSMYGYRSPKGYTLPKSKGKAIVTTFGLSDQLERYVVCLAKVGDSEAKYDRLWVDWNRDRTFADDEMIMPEEAGHDMNAEDDMQCFGPVEVPPGSGRPTKICFLLQQDTLLRVLPKEVRTGVLSVGEKSYNVALVDANLDGRYDAAGLGDAVLIDMNGNGKFEGGQSIAMAMMMEPGTAQEVMLLNRYVQLPDSAFYKADVQSDGTVLTFRRDPSKEGIVSGLGAGSTLSLILDGAPIAATPANGVVRLPEGVYRVMGATVAVPAPKGKPWTLSVSDYRASGKMTIKPGTEKKIGYGLPVKLAVDVRKYGGAYSISVDLRDRGNVPVSDVRKPDGNYPAEPVLKLTDAKGKVLKTEKFHYG